MPESRSEDHSFPPARPAGAVNRTSRLAVAAQLAEVVAAVAVVVSLVYVGRQLRNNTAAIRGSSVQATTISASQSLLEAATDSSLARILRVGSQDPSRLTPTETWRREAFVRQFWLISQSVYLQNELGTMEPREWTTYARIICDVWSRPGTRASWPLHRDLLDQGFAELVESCPSS